MRRSRRWRRFARMFGDDDPDRLTTTILAG
jgi:hypothetical protein